ncbi:MAG: hypothetical protein V7785_13395 [Bermanella sp.]
MNLLKTSILLALIFIIAGCANNMVLYKNDVADIDLSSDSLPRTRSCQGLKRAYDRGFTIRIKNGTRWVNSEDIERYKCTGHDSVYCQNTSARITKLTKSDEGIIAQCGRDIRLANAIKRARKSVPKSAPKLDQQKDTELAQIKEEKKRLNTQVENEYLQLEEKRIKSEKEKVRLANQEKIRQELQRDATSNKILEKLASVEFQGVKPVSVDLAANMYSLVESVISSVDVNDFKGEVVLGVSKNLPITLEQAAPYSVLQVTKDRVYLSCGEECGLPIIGIVRVNLRPSPIEKIEYNDTRAVYMFLGVEHFYLKKDRLRGDSSEVQSLLFHRITMRDLGLPKDFFEKISSAALSLN